MTQPRSSSDRVGVVGTVVVGAAAVSAGAAAVAPGVASGAGAGVAGVIGAAVVVVGVKTVRGKGALWAYWASALERIQTLRFSVDRVLWDERARELAIIYTSETNGQSKRVSENLTFGANGLVVRAEVFHGVG